MSVSPANGMERTINASQASRLRSPGSIEVCSVRRDSKRKAGNHRDDSRYLPASQDNSADSRGKLIVATTEGKCVGKALFIVESAIKV